MVTAQLRRGSNVSVPGRRHPVGSISPFFCFELFQPTGDLGGAERGHRQMPSDDQPVGLLEERVEQQTQHTDHAHDREHVGGA